MRAPSLKIPVSARIFFISFRDAARNWPAHVSIGLFLCLLIFIFKNLWTAVAQEGSMNISPISLIWYLAIAEIPMMAIPRVTKTFEQDVQAGRFASLLCRLLGFFRQAFCEAFGIACFRSLVIISIGFSFCYLLSGALPTSFLGLYLILFLSLLSVILSLVQQMTLSVIALWIYEASPPFWIWQKLAFLLGGMLLPLDYYPDWLRMIAFATPFSVMVYGPASLVLHPELEHAAQIFIFLLLWLLASMLTFSCVARAGIRHAVLTGKGS